MEKKSLRLVFIVCGLGVADCGSDSDGGEGCDPEPMQTSDTHSAAESSTTSSTTTTSGNGSDADGADDGSGTLFSSSPDAGPDLPIECDVFEQDCPPGYKCMPYTLGNGAWSLEGCFPVHANPGQPGDECTVEGSATSGMDDCDVGAMCWDVDPETNTGTCAALCGGSEADPMCEDFAACAFITDVLPLCLQTCEPLPIGRGCPDGQGCYLTFFPNEWVCGPNESGKGYGEACDLFNDCVPGFVCENASAIPMGCEHPRCCTEVCDHSAPECQEGQTCLPQFEMNPPPGLENVGICGVL